MIKCNNDSPVALMVLQHWLCISVFHVKIWLEAGHNGMYLFLYFHNLGDGSRRIMSSRSTLSIQWVWDQHFLYNILSWKTKERKKQGLCLDIEAEVNICTQAREGLNSATWWGNLNFKIWSGCLRLREPPASAFQVQGSHDSDLNCYEINPFMISLMGKTMHRLTFYAYCI